MVAQADRAVEAAPDLAEEMEFLVVASVEAERVLVLVVAVAIL